jgi:hypothetical protein
MKEVVEVGGGEPAIGVLRDSSIGKGQWDKGSSSTVVFLSKEEEMLLYSNRQRRYRRRCVSKERREREQKQGRNLLIYPRKSQR